MKKLALFLLAAATFSPSFLAGQKSAPQPPDYPLIVHVTFSRSVQTSTGGMQQQLQAVVNGQQVELAGGTNGILAPGDYSGRLEVNYHAYKHTNSYDLYETYILLLPDGKTREFEVTGLGPAVNKP